MAGQHEHRDEAAADELSRAMEQQTRHVRRIVEEVEQRRRAAENEGLNFTSPTEEQFLRKLKKMNSPMIVWQQWTGTVPVGGTITYSVGISNPDPVARGALFVHLFVGPANVAPDVSDALSAVDTRFPRLTLPRFAGLTIDPGTTQSLTFALKTPPALERSNYLGNAFLFQATWHDPGEYLDRALFVFEAT